MKPSLPSYLAGVGSVICPVMLASIHAAYPLDLPNEPWACVGVIFFVVTSVLLWGVCWTMGIWVFSEAVKPSALVAEKPDDKPAEQRGHHRADGGNPP